MGGGGSKATAPAKGGGGRAAANGGGGGGTASGGSGGRPVDMAKLDPVLPGDFFGKRVPLSDITFVDDEPIGRGAFGSVWKAVVRNKLVAVKQLDPPGEGGNAAAPADGKDKKNEMIYDFYHETTMMEKLKHPNIVLFLGTVSADPNYCIITELMSGCVGDLLRLCRHKEMSMTWGLTLGIARDCAKAMAYLHGLDPPMIHRNLKSENLLINEDFVGKVADFGLARFEDTATTMTMCGTPSWVAPEVFRGEPYTHTCDVYSFAILLWELVTQEKPHHGMDVSTLGLEVGVQGLRPPMPPNCPRLINHLLQNCWQDGGPSNVKNHLGCAACRGGEVAGTFKCSCPPAAAGSATARPGFDDIIEIIDVIARDGPPMGDVVECGTGERNYDTWLATQQDKEYDQMSMPQLKEECRQLGINDRGNQQELVHRLEECDRKLAEKRQAEGCTPSDAAVLAASPPAEG